jgi:hypothetical protein
MTNTDYTTTILVDQTPKESFDAINNVRGWWSQEINGSTDTLNSEFNYRYKNIHHCTMKIIESIPAQKVVWLVTANYFSFTEDKTEWVGNKLLFEIAEKDNKTEIRFTQQGLTPAYECYDVCHDGWNNYINNSLHDLITKGEGSPNPKEGEGFNAELAEKWKINE